MLKREIKLDITTYAARREGHVERLRKAYTLLNKKGTYDEASVIFMYLGVWTSDFDTDPTLDYLSSLYFYELLNGHTCNENICVRPPRGKEIDHRGDGARVMLFDQGLLMLQRAIVSTQGSPEEWGGHYELESFYKIAGGDLDGALQSSLKALELRPNHRSALTGLANVYVQLREFDKVPPLIDKAFENDKTNSRRKDYDDALERAIREAALNDS